MTRRRLTPEEIELWRRVAARAERLHPDRPDPDPRAKPKPKPTPTRRSAARFEPFELGQKGQEKSRGHDLQTGLTERLANAPVQMDQKAFQRMKRGKLKPEARVDLHGMRLDQAHGVLIRFILSSQASGCRLVLVITGKGKHREEPGPIPTPRGVLKHQVPQWLRMPPMAQAVLQVTPAHQRHGGEGAYYVYLRRAR
ncbi:MAG TPA: DNA mismatch repair protein MutS [Rhodobacteraceae bacterium]|nr:DNA mismatch repair protein MutS [Paracoccaceae bacterium]